MLAVTLDKRKYCVNLIYVPLKKNTANKQRVNNSALPKQPYVGTNNLYKHGTTFPLLLPVFVTFKHKSPKNIFTDSLK